MFTQTPPYKCGRRIWAREKGKQKEERKMMRLLGVLAVCCLFCSSLEWCEEAEPEQDVSQGIVIEEAVFEEPGEGQEKLAEIEEDAYDSGFAVYTLGEIVISEERPAVREISIVNEVTAEEIEATNSRTAAEALSFVPGVEVSTGRKNEPEISIHGLEQRKTLILIDGVPYYETNYGKLDLNQIPADIIARIDVVKGAPSVLYGPNAEVGVINIITKTAAGKPTFSAFAEVGDENYFRTSLSHGMRVGKFHYWLNYSHREAEGFPLSDDFDPEVGSLTLRPGGTTDAIFGTETDARIRISTATACGPNSESSPMMIPNTM
jgi:outer membrane receptor for ferric coprogen and ferric-rhodotorulic acid